MAGTLAVSRRFGGTDEDFDGRLSDAGALVIPKRDANWRGLGFVVGVRQIMARKRREDGVVELPAVEPIVVEQGPFGPLVARRTVDD